MKNIARLAAAQTVPVAADIDANMQQHLQLVEAAASQGVTLLVFPELSLTGYELAAGPRLALEPHDARLGPLLAAARKHDMSLVVGAPVTTAAGLHIGAFVVEPTGALHLYTKQHLGAFRPEDHPDGIVPPPEDRFFSSGTLNPACTWRSYQLAISICADASHPSHLQAAAERGAQLYLSCQFAIAPHMAFKLSRLKDAARRHRLVVVFSNYGGPTGGLPAAGGSGIRSTDDEAVVRLPAEGRGLAIAWEDEGRWQGEALLVD